MTRTAQALLSVLVGAAYAPAWLWLLSHFIAATPHLSWLIDLGLRGNAIRITSGAIDLIVNIALALIPAFALVKINENRKIGAALAVIAWICTLSVLTRDNFVANLFKTPSMILLVAAMPIAVFIVGKIIARRPNNSFKPTPLRGAA